MAGSESRPSNTTRQAEREEAKKGHLADREPTAEEADLASAQEDKRSAEEAESVAAHEREMAERGANQKGEGRVD